MLPVWLVSAFWEYGIPILITILERLGFVGWAKALAIKAFAKLETVKKYSEPKDFPEPPPIKPEQPEGTTNTNLTVDGYRDQGPNF